MHIYISEISDGDLLSCLLVCNCMCVSFQGTVAVFPKFDPLASAVAVLLVPSFRQLLHQFTLLITSLSPALSSPLKWLVLFRLLHNPIDI